MTVSLAGVSTSRERDVRQSNCQTEFLFDRIHLSPSNLQPSTLNPIPYHLNPTIQTPHPNLQPQAIVLRENAMTVEGLHAAIYSCFAADAYTPAFRSEKRIY